MDAKNISAAIVAGGAAKRMGGVVKSKIVIDNETIISRMMQVIGGIFDEIIIVTNCPGEFEEFDRPLKVGDFFQKKGPLGGIHSAMLNTSKEAVFVFAGDMPFLSADLIKRQLSLLNMQSDAIVPSIGSDIEPLHAIYRTSIYGELEKLLTIKNSISVRDFLSHVRVEYFKLPDNRQNRIAFTNINTPEDLKK